jgi:ferredoxin
MRIHIDEKLCSGHGRCYSLEPSVFQADDDGYPLQRGLDVDIQEGGEEAARRGVANCPEGAISIIGD